MLRKNMLVVTKCKGLTTTGFFPKNCINCKEKFCCKIQPSFLTRCDVIRLKTIIQMYPRCVVKHKVKGVDCLFLRKVNNHCYFYDVKSGECMVYDFRPLDCRLFPLDVLRIHDKYFWICYDCSGKVEVTEMELQKLERTALIELLPQLKEYATIKTSFFYKGKFHILREVRIPLVQI